MHRVHLCGRHTQESTVPPETAARPAPIPRARSRKTARATPACFESRRAQTGAAKNSVHTRTPSSRNNPKRCVLAFYFSKLVFKKGKSCHPIRNGSNCCPAGFAAHACKLRLATVRIVARRVRCPRLRHVFLCFVSSWGRRLTPPYPTLPQAACTPTPPAPPSSASLSSGSPLLHIRPGMLDTTTSPQALLPLRRREA